MVASQSGDNRDLFIRHRCMQADQSNSINEQQCSEEIRESTLLDHIWNNPLPQCVPNIQLSPVRIEWLSPLTICGDTNTPPNKIKINHFCPTVEKYLARLKQLLSPCHCHCHWH